jgi:ComF family protein
LGDTFAKPLITLLNDAHWPIEMIVPVPVGIARMRERGYNQSAFIALPLALGVGLPYCPGALKRVRETRSQVDLSLAERKDNVKKAFQADRRMVKDRTVLIVDDVMTSGATLDSCAAALLEGGASQVYCLTLARAASQAASL